MLVAVGSESVLSVAGKVAPHLLGFDWCTGHPGCTAGHPDITQVAIEFEDGVVLSVTDGAEVEEKGEPRGGGGIAPGGVWIMQPASCSWCVRVVEVAGQQRRSPWPVPYSRSV